MMKEEFLVELWEKSYGQHNLEAAITLLNMASPAVTKREIAGMNIGSRNFLLFSIREKLFGKVMSCFTACPECNAQYEFNFSPVSTDGLMEESDEEFTFNSGICELLYRLPNSFDLAAASKAADIDSARNILLNNCITKLFIAGKLSPVSDLPEDIILKLSEEMSEKNRFLETVVALNCKDCKSSWNVNIDIGDFLLREINFYAKKLMSDIHILASAYHWSEREILSLSPHKRKWYINELTS